MKPSEHVITLMDGYQVLSNTYREMRDRARDGRQVLAATRYEERVYMYGCVIADLHYLATRLELEESGE